MEVYTLCFPPIVFETRKVSVFGHREARGMKSRGELQNLHH